MTSVANFPPVSTTPAATLPPVSTTLAANLPYQYQRHRRQIFPPVSLVLLTPVANLPPLSTIPAANYRNNYQTADNLKYIKQFKITSSFYCRAIVKHDPCVTKISELCKHRLVMQPLQNQSLCSSTNSSRRQAVSISLAYGFFWEARA
jgi:hypothetical protein